jgi:hypothetical protein
MKGNLGKTTLNLSKRLSKNVSLNIRFASIAGGISLPLAALEFLSFAVRCCVSAYPPPPTVSPFAFGKDCTNDDMNMAVFMKQKTDLFVSAKDADAWPRIAICSCEPHFGA